MDSYRYSQLTNRPASPPLPDDMSGGYVPSMPEYSGRTSQSRYSAPQIDYGSASQGGSAIGYSSRSSRRGGVTEHSGGPSESGSVAGYSSRSSRRGSVAGHSGGPSESGSVMGYSGGAMGGSSRYSQGQASGSTSRVHRSSEYKSAITRDLREAMSRGVSVRKFSERVEISRATLQEWLDKGYDERSARVTRTNYTPEQRSTLTRELRQSMARGESMREYSQRTNVKEKTLSAWLRAGEGQSRDSDNT